MDNSNTMEINTILEVGWDGLKHTKGTFHSFCDGDKGYLVATRDPKWVLKFYHFKEKVEKEGGVQKHTLHEEKP